MKPDYSKNFALVLECKEASFQYHDCGNIEWRERFEKAEAELEKLTSPVGPNECQPYMD